MVRSASNGGKLELVKYLVEEEGADIHARDDYAVRRAFHNDHFDVVEYLVSLGANVKSNNNELIRIYANNREKLQYIVSLSKITQKDVDQLRIAGCDAAAKFFIG